MMRRDSLYYASVVALFGFLDPASAFVPPQQQQSNVGTALRLVPGQGNQLVAAYNAAHYKDENEEEAEVKAPAAATAITVEKPTAPTAAGRSFVKRAFNLPSNMIRRHPHPKAELLEEDVVVYPVLGFTFCRNGDRVVALPTTSNVSCRLPTPNKNEELYGWYSPMCKLDLYAEDPCHPPEEK